MRHACLLSLLPGAPKRAGIEELRGKLRDCGFEVDATTIRKDLNKLSRYFPIVCDGSRPVGWSWAAEPPPFVAGAYEPSLAVAVMLGAAHGGDALPPTLRAALARHVARAEAALDAQGPRGLGALVRRFRAVAGGDDGDALPVDADVLEAVGRAVATGRRLSVRRPDEPRALRLEALGLLRRGATLQLVARRSRGDDVRVVALHRLASARLLEEPADRDDFDLDAWLAGGPRVAIVARLRPGLAERLEDAPLSADQTLEPFPDGALRLRATVVDGAGLHARLLGFGGDLVVEAPDAPAKDVVRAARAVVAAYAGVSSAPAAVRAGPRGVPP